MPYEYAERLPTPAEHRALAEAVGWSHAFDWEAIPASLEASFAGVVVTDLGETVGMGRVIGDGCFYFYVQDVVVLPSHQGQGIGSRILENLVEQIERTAPPKSFIGLFAAGTTVPWYRRHGFAVQESMTGMFRVVLPSRR